VTTDSITVPHITAQYN